MGEKEARIARLAEGVSGVNTLSVTRTIPIIVLPGVMGTRLTDPGTGNLVWNPTGNPLPRFAARGQAGFAAKTKRLADVTSPLVPDETHPCTSSNSARDHETELLASNIENFLHLIPDFYADITLQLDDSLRARLNPRKARPKVICCGYDWRVANEISAARLSAVVDKARDESGGEKVFLVAHSMGGLVSRFYCKNLGGESKVAAIFLLASPSLGAPSSYGALRTGIGVLDPLRTVLGFFTRNGSRDFTRQLLSVYQLLPNRTYCNDVDRNWIRFDPNFTGILPVGFDPIQVNPFSDCSNETFLYNDLYVGLMDEPDLRALSFANVTAALAFQQSLLDGTRAAYMHPNTFAVFGDGLKTILSYDARNPTVLTSTSAIIEISSSTEEATQSAGDKTVPTESAFPKKTTNPFAKTLQLSGPDHQHVPADATAIEFVVNNIDALI